MCMNIFIELELESLFYFKQRSGTNISKIHNTQIVTENLGHSRLWFFGNMILLCNFQVAKEIDT